MQIFLEILSNVNRPTVVTAEELVADMNGSGLIYPVSGFVHHGWRVCTHIIECDSKSKQLSLGSRT